jgi:hypothetical protein
MSKKYLSAASPAIITNDLFLAAFLVSVGCTLDRIEKNERRRVSFVFVDERVRELREAYRTGPVQVDMCVFRDNLNKLRDSIGSVVAGHYPDERSTPCLRVQTPPPIQIPTPRVIENSPTMLSPA